MTTINLIAGVVCIIGAMADLATAALRGGDLIYTRCGLYGLVVGVWLIEAGPRRRR